MAPPPDDIFASMTLDEFCERSGLPRHVVERYLVATDRERLFSESQFLANWQFLVADLPAFQAYLKYNEVGRSEREIAARADAITSEIWRYAGPRQRGRHGVKQRLSRIRDRLRTLQFKTSGSERGKRVARCLEKFPYLKAEELHQAALEKIRPGRPPTVSEAIAVVEHMLAELPKAGQWGNAQSRVRLIELLDADHAWLTGKPRRQYAARFREFVKELLESNLNASLQKEGLQTDLNANTLIR